MKILNKSTTVYHGKVTIAAGEMVEVEAEEAQRLLRTFPEWFEAVGGEPSPEAEVSVNPVIGEKSIPAPPRSKPFKAKGK